MNGINLELPAIPKKLAYSVVVYLLALIFCTYLRVSFLFLYPLFVILLYYGFNWKLDRNAIYLFVFVVVAWIFSFRHGLYLKYNLISLYYFFPLLLLLFARPQPLEPDQDYLHPLMNAITMVMIVNNLVGLIQYIQHPFDDSFEGLYGSFTVSQNGLSLINGLLFFYHLNLFQKNGSSNSLILGLFFLFSCLMGFYGAGLIALIGAFVLTFLRFRLKNLIIVTISLLLMLTLAYFVLRLVSPLAIDYNVNILKKFLDPSAPGAPRKLIIFRNYIEGYSQNIWDLLFGSGPGTFNSRSAFLVGSPSYFRIEAIKSDVQPFYFQHYAYTLWNPSNTGPYDGFMNQPFTSLLALLGEYGLLLTLAVVYLIMARYKAMVKTGRGFARSAAMNVEFKLARFCTMLALILLVIDNYMEYPEIICLLLLLAKLAHQRLRTAAQT